jgi:hypothetical protein
MTESQIETQVEKAIDRLDRQLMRNEITQTDYDREVSIVDKWATQQLDHLSN